VHSLANVCWWYDIHATTISSKADQLQFNNPWLAINCCDRKGVSLAWVNLVLALSKLLPVGLYWCMAGVPSSLSD